MDSPELGLVSEDLSGCVAKYFDCLGPEIHNSKNLHDVIMRQLERPLLQQVYDRTGHNAVRTSRILGLNRNTVNKKLRAYGIK